MTSALNMGKTPRNWLTEDHSHRLKQLQPPERLSRNSEFPNRFSQSPFGGGGAQMKNNQLSSNRITMTTNQKTPQRRSQSPFAYSSQGFRPSSFPQESSEQPFPAYNQSRPSKSIPVDNSSSFGDRTYHGNKYLLCNSMRLVLKRRLWFFILLSLSIDFLFIGWFLFSFSRSEFLQFFIFRIFSSFLSFRLAWSRVDFSSDFLQVLSSLFLVPDSEILYLFSSFFFVILEQSALFNAFYHYAGLPKETDTLINSASIRLTIFLSRIFCSAFFIGAVLYNSRLRRFRDMEIRNQGQWRQILEWIMKFCHFSHAFFIALLFSLLNGLIQSLFVSGAADLSWSDRTKVIFGMLRPQIYFSFVFFFVGVFQQYVRFGLIAKIPSRELGQITHGFPLCFSIYTTKEKLGNGPSDSFSDFVHFHCLNYIWLNIEQLCELYFFQRESKGNQIASDFWGVFFSYLMDYMDEFQRQLTETSYSSERMRIKRDEELRGWNKQITRFFLDSGIERQIFLKSFRNMFFLKENLKVLEKCFNYGRQSDKMKHLNCGNTFETAFQKIERIIEKLRQFDKIKRKGFTSFPFELSYYDDAIVELEGILRQLASTE